MLFPVRDRETAKYRRATRLTTEGFVVRKLFFHLPEKWTCQLWLSAGRKLPKGRRDHRNKQYQEYIEYERGGLGGATLQVEQGGTMRFFDVTASAEVLKMLADQET
jgi:hypothetical protein